MTAPLSPDDAAAVLRRAAELDATALVEHDGLDEQVVREAAREVGLSELAVDQAVQEWRSGALEPLPALRPDRRLGLLATTAAERLVPLPAERCAAGLDAWLRGQWFERRRTRGNESEWAPRGGALAGARRAVDLTHALRLSGVRRVRVCVAPAPGGARLRVVADLGDARSSLLAGLVALPAVMVGVGVGAALGLPGDALPEVLLAAPAAAAAGGAGWAAARTALDRRLATVHEELERVLDELAGPPRPGLPERLAAWLPRPR